MEKFIEILTDVLSPIIAGIFAFLVTKYTYNKNIPLDKLEIAYNRIYYPICQLLRDKNLKEVNSNISKISFYFQKYNKYADRATLKAFNLFYKQKDEETLQNLKNNIYKKDAYLRKRLGYLESSILQMYTYSSKSEKSNIRLFLEIIMLYFCTISIGITKGLFQIIAIKIVILIVIIIIVEVICKFSVSFAIE